MGSEGGYKQCNLTTLTLVVAEIDCPGGVPFASGSDGTVYIPVAPYKFLSSIGARISKRIRVYFLQVTLFTEEQKL